MPIKVLFRGWWQIPHSYAICFSFQLVYLYKNYGPDGLIKKNAIEFFLEEMPYYQPHWYNNKKLVYPAEYNEILKSLKKYNGEDIDIVYSQTYPYNIENTHPNIPKCVFYTSEFAKLSDEYFTGQTGNIKEYLENNKNINFIAPSSWSSLGIKEYLNEQNRNTIISHGADTNIFKYDKQKRDEIRLKYKIKKEDILMINIGSMTRNKGIIIILQTLHILVNVLKKSNYKLLLKGTSDLYQSKIFLEIYFAELFNNGNGFLNKNDIDNLLENHIIFLENTLSYERINDLFNASDVYISPYLAEGFNLVPLEYLASGGNVLIPQTGSTEKYMKDIFNNGGKDFIHYISSYVKKDNNDLMSNEININDLVNKLLTIDFHSQKNNELLLQYIHKEYSWNNISKIMFEYFLNLIK